MSQAPKRSGYTLRELTLAMTLGSTVFFAATGLVTQAFQWSDIGRARRQDDQSFFRLQKDLAFDIHGASDVNIADDRLTLSTKDGAEITYQIQPRTIKRSELRAGEVTHREAYRWKRAYKVELRRLSPGDQVELAVSKVLPDSESTPIWRVVRASVGLRLKHESGEIE
ncbi:MAG: hypothetical protein AAFU85_29300 [Planctomycetota bacterium]